MSKLAENIRKFREAKELSQEQLAKLLGYKGKSAVANWENGYNSPTDDKIQMMLDIFEVDANTLFGWDNAAQIKSDAEELASLILKDERVKELIEVLKNISDEDMQLLISFAKRLKKDGEKT